MSTFIPASPLDIGDDPIDVQQTLSVLLDDSTDYQVRVVATNASGDTTSDWFEFTTPAAPPPVALGGGMSYGAAINAVIDEGGFDSSRSNTSRTVIGRWINAAHKEMVRKARYLGEYRDLGPTIAGQDSYGIDADIVEIQDISVGGMTYFRKGRRLLRGMQSYDVRRLVSGIFTPTYSPARVPQVTLSPVPIEDGASMLADVFLEPAAMTDEDTDFLLVPDEFCEAIIDKAAAIGMARVDSNPFLAQSAKDEFDAKTEELRRAVNMRVNSGSVQMRVVG